MKHPSGRLTAAALAALGPGAAQASFLSGDTLDSAAMALAWFIIFVVPIAVVALFLIVHVLPEKIAEKRHHPQQNAIKTLCFLSLVFGGMLWPLAWLWAFTKPVAYRGVYGTEKHDSYFLEMGEKAARGELDLVELDHLREELAQMAVRGPLPKELRDLPGILAQARTRAEAAAATVATAAAGTKAGGGA